MDWGSNRNMAKTSPKKKAAAVDKSDIAPPRQKHKGALGEAMRKGHNAKRMDALRSMKKC